MSFNFRYIYFLFLFFFSVSVYGQLHITPNLSMIFKAGLSIGGSKPASYTNSGESQLIFNPSGGVQITCRLSHRIDVCLDALYVRKTIDCPVMLSTNILKFYTKKLYNIPTNATLSVWIMNDYIEMPLTIGYKWGYGVCRTRIGGYFAKAIHTNAEFLFVGLPSEYPSHYEAKSSTYHSRISTIDTGIKIANEFFMGRFIMSLEFSTGLSPIIKNQWRKSDDRSNTMAIAVYGAFLF